jgi:hypothetical protein
MVCVNGRLALLAMVLLTAQRLNGQVQGAVCVAPYRVDNQHGGSPEISDCASGNISLKIDDRPAVPWSHVDSAMLDPLDLKTRHRVVVLCDGKPQQSFRFRFSEFRSTSLCLFVSDLYRTSQLWERSKAPWCTCR